VAEDREQQTEEATPRKREKLREEGQVIKSQDVGAAAVVVAASLVMGHSFELMGRAAAVFAQRCFRFHDLHEPVAALRGEMLALAPSALPLVAAALAAVVAGAAQARIFSFTLLAPKASRLNPMSNLAQIVPGKQSLIEITKQMLKLLAVGYIGFAVIAEALPLFSTLSSEPPLRAAVTVAQVVGKLILRVCVAFAIAAAVDYWLAHRKYMEDAMMSKQEVRDEHKEQEGRPEIKHRMRRRMQEMTKQRTSADVAQATVVVVNPTHYAVALRYIAEQDAAPVVVAKGLDELALQMRSIARQAGVPVVEQKPLARALYASAKVGRPVPVDLYRAVAEVIAYVMQIKARDRGALMSPSEPAGEA
jgi:flagellar biosynthesis protein FlhB